MATRSRGMPRMRSASIALLGFDETRISFSRSDVTVRTILCVPLGGESAKGSLQAPLQMLRSPDARQTLPDEESQPGVNGRALLALGAKTEVAAELFEAGVGEGSVEEKVDCAFDIVTKHYCFS